MTRKLEELFDLPPNEGKNETPLTTEETKTFIAEIDDTIDKIDAALPTVHDLEAADTEMDHLAKLAEDKFNDLMDLGMNVDPRFAGVILQTASTMLGLAITAKVDGAHQHHPRTALLRIPEKAARRIGGARRHVDGRAALRDGQAAAGRGHERQQNAQTTATGA